MAVLTRLKNFSSWFGRLDLFEFDKTFWIVTYSETIPQIVAHKKVPNQKLGERVWKGHSQSWRQFLLKIEFEVSGTKMFLFDM